MPSSPGSADQWKVSTAALLETKCKSLQTFSLFVSDSSPSWPAILAAMTDMQSRAWTQLPTQAMATRTSFWWVIFPADFHSLSKDDVQVHKTSYLGFLRYLVRSAYQRSHPFTLPYVRAVRVKQWEFIPDGVSASIMNCFL